MLTKKLHFHFDKGRFKIFYITRVHLNMFDFLSTIHLRVIICSMESSYGDFHIWDKGHNRPQQDTTIFNEKVIISQQVKGDSQTAYYIYTIIYILKHEFAERNVKLNYYFLTSYKSQVDSGIRKMFIRTAKFRL